MIDGQQDFEFLGFTRNSSLNEINHFHAPFLWFDGEKFRKESTQQATQFVIECRSSEDAKDLLALVNDPDIIQIEVDTEIDYLERIDLPLTHAYIENENIVVLTAIHK